MQNFGFHISGGTFSGNIINNYHVTEGAGITGSGGDKPVGPATQKALPSSEGRNRQPLDKIYHIHTDSHVHTFEHAVGRKKWKDFSFVARRGAGSQELSGKARSFLHWAKTTPKKVLIFATGNDLAGQHTTTVQETKFHSDTIKEYKKKWPDAIFLFIPLLSSHVDIEKQEEFNKIMKTFCIKNNVHCYDVSRLQLYNQGWHYTHKVMREIYGFLKGLEKNTQISQSQPQESPRQQQPPQQDLPPAPMNTEN